MNLDEFRTRYRYDTNKDLVGEGGFAKVYRAFDNITKREVALKFYHGDSSEKYGVIQELKKVMRLQHPNLIRYYDAVLLSSPTLYDPNAKIQVGIAEFANAGDLNDFIKTFPSLDEIAIIVRGILEGLDHLHQNGIVHRDIKPQNILLHKENGIRIAKITDFGLAKELQQGEVSSKLMGTMEYMAPEQFDAKKFGINNKFGTNVDLWSFGVILYEIFTGDLPFGNRHEGATHEQLLFNILQKDFNADLEGIDEPYQTLIRQCLVRRATQRAATARQLINILDGNPESALPNLLDADTQTHGGFLLTSQEKKQLLLQGVLFSPLSTFYHYSKHKKQYPEKAALIRDFLWYTIPIWIAFWLLILMGIMTMLYLIGSL